MSWRDRAKPIIARVLADTRGQDEKAIRKALSDAYPFGPKQYHPYKIWLNEIKFQRGLKKPKQRPGFKRLSPAPDPRQTSLLET